MFRPWLALLLTACSAAVQSSPPTQVDIASQLASLERETGSAWQIRVEPTLATPAYLEGRTVPLAATPDDAERAARSFVDAHQTLFALPSSALATETKWSDSLGTTHVRFAQREQELIVWGSELLAHFDATGSLVRVNGHYGPVTLPATLTPAVTTDQARVEAATLTRWNWPAVDPSSLSTTTPTLLLYPVDGAPGQPRTAKLAWRLTVKGSTNDDAPVQVDTLIDALDGSALTEVNRVETVLGSGVGVFGDRHTLSVTAKTDAYYLEDDMRGGDTPSRTFSSGGGIHIPGSELRSGELDKWDMSPTHGVAGSAVDAHAYVATTWDYFANSHDRLGWANDGVGVRAVVHYGSSYGNAFYDGAELVFGDGNAAMTATSAALDIVAHEYTHGVVAASAALDPSGVPGAIDEGIADLFGCLVSQGSGQGSEWQIGETIFHPLGGQNTPLRDLANPHATGQPATRGEVAATIDPHVDASIVGHLGYILAEGSPYGVKALGSDFVGKLFYRALTTYLFSEAGWDELADALTASVRDVDETREDDVLQALIQMGLR